MTATGATAGQQHPVTVPRVPTTQLELPLTPPAPVDRCQRWANGQQHWAHLRGERFDPNRYEVHALDDRTAKAFVERNHYAKSYPAASRRYGLFDTRDGANTLAGVAVFGIPVQAAVLTSAFPELEPYRQSLELSRFVLLDDVAANGESWFLARAHTELLSAGVRGVVSFADPVQRRAADGTKTAPGHVGVIYQASNALYAGRGTARTLTVLPDGTVLNARAQSKVRRGEQGHEYVEKKLVTFGATTPREGQDMAVWLRQALADIGAASLRHRGNHRYLFRLGNNRRDRERVTVGLPVIPTYPKFIDT